MPEYKVRDVTPTLAARWLKANTHNRNIRQRLVDAFARDMENGNWVENGESIKFDDAGNLLDGQHRLLAVVKSGATVRMMVVTGLEQVVQETVDTGASRNFSDLLSLRGETDASTLAAITRRVNLWDSGAYDTRQSIRPTNSELLSTLDKNSELLTEAVHVARRVRNKMSIPASIIGLAYTIFTDIDEEDAADFFEKLSLGDDLNVHHPVLVLRKTINDYNRPKSRQRMREEYVLAIIIKTWNAYRDGRLVTTVRWRSGGAHPETFPVPH